MKAITRSKLRVYYPALKKYQITAVCAPRGYGKTTFVCQFLSDHLRRRYKYYDMNRLEHPFFPDAVYDYLVLDNFCIEQDLSILHAVKQLVKRRKKLHVIIISEELLPDIVHEWRCENLAYIIGTQALFFDHHELYELLKLNNFNTKGDTVEKIQNLCGGWILAIVLFLNGSVTGSYRFFPNHQMIRMMKAYVYRQLTQDMRKLFMKLSILRDFTYEELLCAYDGTMPIRPLILMMEVGFLLHYDARNQSYRFYEAFRIVLHEELASSGCSIRKVHKQIGQYYAAKAAGLKMLYHYYHAEEYEAISHFLNECTGSSLSVRDPTLMKSIYKAISDTLLPRYPYAYLRMIQDYTNVLHEPYLAELRLHIFMEHVEVHSCEAHLMGEALLCYGFLQFNHLYRMFTYFKQAAVILNGTVSRFANPGSLLPNGCIFLLFLYHRKEGELKGLLEFIHGNIGCYMELSSHADAGFEELAKAEYQLETGNYQKAKLYVWEAYYAACRYMQTSVRIPALTALGRLSFITEDYETMDFAMNQLERGLHYVRDGSSFEMGMESSLLYLRCLRNEEVELLDWMKNRKYTCEEAFYKYIIIGQVLINQHRYVELKTVAGILKNILQTHVFARIYGELYTTIAILFTEGIAAARPFYDQLIAVCEKDRIVGVILERKHILKSVITGGNHTGFARYVKQICKQEFPADILFTDREYEVMQYISNGYSIVKVAERMHLKRNTVYSYLKHIYRKLGINCRDELLDYISRYEKLT